MYEKQLAAYAALTTLHHTMGEQVCSTDNQVEEYIKWEKLTALQTKGLIGKLKSKRPAISNNLPGQHGKKQEVTYNKAVVSRSIIERDGDLYSVMVCAKPRQTKASKPARNEFDKYR